MGGSNAFESVDSKCFPDSFASKLDFGYRREPCGALQYEMPRHTKRVDVRAQRRFSIFGADYWSLSRDPGVGAALVLPLWIGYEFGALTLNRGWAGRIRTGVDYLLTTVISEMGFPAVFSGLAVLLILLLLILRHGKNEKWGGFRARYFSAMLLESAVYATCVGFVVSSLSSHFLSVGAGSTERTLAATLVVNIGAGVYEELVFRVSVFSGLVFIAGKVGSLNKRVVSVWSVIASSVLFASFHYLPLFGESFALDTYLFRLFAGVLLCLLFIMRGFGITAYTHSLYNVFLIFRTTPQ